jgi:mono/diheme cytochrome c family protein
MRIPVAAFAVVVACGASFHVFAQTTGPTNPPLVIRSLVGRELFEFYCTSCHGRDGKGSGPVASALKVPPPDLTTLARRNDGAFPARRVEDFVTNGGDAPTPAHGSSEMPIWGPVFRALESSDGHVRVRIANIVAYIQSIQVR